jgi:acyl-CoA synthetase (AMP-forming)/AMP-acid ligase II
MSARDAYYYDRGLWSDERIGWTITRAAERWPQGEAIVFGSRRVTYSQLWRWSTRVASDLVAAGIGPGDRVLWQLPNSLEAVALHLAAWRIGAVSVPVVPLYREHELAHILADARPLVVAAASTVGERHPAAELTALLDRSGQPGDRHRPALRLAVGECPDGWKPIPSEPDDDEPITDLGLPDPASAREVCLILYTSGTTSAPKGARHCSRSLLAEAETWRDAYGFSSGSRFIMGAPITHIAGLLLTLVVPARCGATAVLLPAWDPDVAVRLAEQERATFCCGATVFLQGFVERYEQGASASHRLSVFMCGGSAVPPALIERADAVGVNAFRCWGMTEAPTTTLALPDDPLEFRAYRDGRASEGTEIEAVDEDRQPLKDGEIGELRIRSPEQMMGYTDPAVNSRQTDEEGWFYTGDVGFTHGDGWVTMTGRIKDIINRGGEKFSAQDIEAVICSHPAIAAVAVTGVPDDRLGERVAAFVTLREGSPWPGRASLLAHLEDRKMARQKFPVVWRVLDEIPMTMSGKVQKHRLLDMWDAELAACPEPD